MSIHIELPCIHRLHRRAALGAATALCAGALHGQRSTSSVDVGGAQVRYADRVSTTTASVSPAIEFLGDRLTAGASGSYSRVAGGWSTQGGVQASLFTPAVGPLLGELSGTTGGSAHWDGTRTARSLGIARAHAMGTSRGLWAGAGLGTTWDIGGWQAMQLGEVGAWSRIRATTVVASIAPTRVADTLRFADASAAVRVELPRLELGVTAGHRSGDDLPALDGAANVWGSVSLVGWTNEHVAVVASAGTYPVDLTQGFPGGRFASIALRFGRRPLARHERAARDAMRTAAAPSPAADGSRAMAIRVVAAGDRHVIRVHAPGATSVEIDGDFTGWSPVRLAQAGAGWWTIAIALEPGMREIVMRIDRGEWSPPSGLPTMRDEFGGVVGLLTVP